MSVNSESALYDSVKIRYLQSIVPIMKGATVFGATAAAIDVTIASYWIAYSLLTQNLMYIGNGVATLALLPIIIPTAKAAHNVYKERKETLEQMLEQVEPINGL